MSLRHKIVAILSAVVALYALIDHAIQRATVVPSFAGLEREEAFKDLRRVVDAIENEKHLLEERCRQWAAWDATYAFAGGERGPTGSPPIAGVELDEAVLASQRLSLLYLCDLEGRVLWGAVLDPRSGQRARLRDFPGEALAPGHPLLARSQSENLFGLMTTELGPLLVGSSPVLRGDGSGPPRGTLILGRFLDQHTVERIVAQTYVPFSLHDLSGEGIPPAERAMVDLATASHEPVVWDGDRQRMHAYTTIPDIRAMPALLVRSERDRDITLQGATATRYAWISTLAAGLLMMLVLLHLLQRTVLSPIAALTAHAVRVGKSEDFSARIQLSRDDEIGILSREFDTAMERLEQAQQALVKAARSAGMSEIATGILHNVGNVLNSVNVSTSLLAKRVDALAVGDLEKLAEVLQQHADDLGRFVTDDPRGKHLQPFLGALSGQLSGQRDDLAQEVRTLEAGVEHIRELINSQQSYAGKSELRESTSLADLLEQALNISIQATAGLGVHRVERELEDVPRFKTDKHKLLEILVNLIQNARQSLEEAAVREPRVVLRLRRAGPERAVIEVADNGKGIPAENLAKIFTHGFTTKRTGHGFGLHTAANAARELGGNLTAQSDGPGRGATFVLEIPMETSGATA